MDVPEAELIEQNADRKSAEAEEAVTPPRLWVAYVLPMALFIGLTALEGQFPAHYIAFYIVKILLVAGAMAACRTAWKDIRFDARVLPIAVIVGLAVFAEWVLLDNWLTAHKIPWMHFGSRTEFNPFEKIGEPGIRGLFLAFRFFGLVVLVPVMEELFWRSFLLRYITEPDFQRLPVGTFSWGAFALVAVGFGLAHPEWLVAVICAAAYGLLLRQTKSLFACVVAHGVTNLALGLYVIFFHAWRFW